MKTRGIHKPNKRQQSGTADDESVRQPATLSAPDSDADEAVTPVPLRVVAADTPAARPASVGAFNAPALAYLPPIITSKIEPPPLRPTTLTRHRLLDKLPFNDPKRVTLIVADPGFGKTTLLADFSSRYPGRCLWYRLDETDRDWITLVNYVVAAARQTVPEFGRMTSTLLVPITGASPSKRAVLGSLMHELQALGDRATTIVFDDFQAVEPSDDVAEFFGQLLRDAPASFSFVIASRRRPSVALAKWAAQDDLVELSTEDLRFSAGETDRLFAEAYGQPLEAELLAELESRTQGWAASLQLFHSLIRGRTSSGIRSAIRSLSGATSPVYDFLAEEVLGQLTEPLAEFTLRSSLLGTIALEYVVAVLDPDTASPAEAEKLMQQAERAGIVTRASHTSSVRQFHPLLREFLERKLREQVPEDEIAAIHHRVALAAEQVDLLAASHHYIEAGQPTEAMRCLAESVIQTMGSGRWGAASQLVEKLSEARPHPAVLAIRARRLLDDGDSREAHALLDGINLTGQGRDVRAVIRHTRLAVGWRNNDTKLMFDTLRAIAADAETPRVLRDISQIFIDTSPIAAVRMPLPTIARRLRRMAQDQAESGHYYYSAISLHNAAVALLNSGSYVEALEVGDEALAAYDRLAFETPDRYSLYSVLATASFELGRATQGEEYIGQAVSSDVAEGDAAADAACALAVAGDRSGAAKLLDRAENLDRVGRLDVAGRHLTAVARAILMLPQHPYAVVQLLERLPMDMPLDLGYTLLVTATLGVAHLLLDNDGHARSLAEQGRQAAAAQGSRRGGARHALVAAMAEGKEVELKAAVAQASESGALALLAVADAVGPRLHIFSAIPQELEDSIANWPSRWLPVLRRQLEAGSTPSAHAAAEQLAKFGELEDVGRLRAFDRTYRRGKGSLSRQLVRRVSPPLQIMDLGRGLITVGKRNVAVNDIRRKPASLLLYLVTRPNFTATREQVLEDLWPDGDPGSGANSLNQTLYFLRREIDPWYEQDVSHDYVAFETELLWLDAELISVASARFLGEVRRLAIPSSTPTELLEVLRLYRGQFCPEFEYDEWAIAWRSRVHAAYLDLAHRGVQRMVNTENLATAAEVASLVLGVDPSAVDMEQKLVWIYAHLGSVSAAEAQYVHLSAGFRSDGLEPPSFQSIVSGTRPT